MVLGINITVVQTVETGSDSGAATRGWVIRSSRTGAGCFSSVGVLGANGMKHQLFWQASRQRTGLKLGSWERLGTLRQCQKSGSFKGRIMETIVNCFESKVLGRLQDAFAEPASWRQLECCDSISARRWTLPNWRKSLAGTGHPALVFFLDEDLISAPHCWSRICRLWNLVSNAVILVLRLQNKVT